MTLLHTTTWQEVFSAWREREGNDPGWINCAVNLKGWPDWASWRSFTAAQFGADKRAWAMYEFTDPMVEIPQMLVGPYTGWQSRLPTANTHSFFDLVRIPEQETWARGHEKIASMMQSFPAPTEMIGLRRADTGQIICIEGHHRATAVALAQKDGLNVVKGPVRIALAPVGVEEIDLLDTMLKRGSSRHA